MNNLIWGAVLRSLVTVAGTAATATGVATSGEVSSIVTNGTTLLGAVSTLVAVGWGIWTRTTTQQVKMTNSLPKVVTPAVAKK